MGESAAASSDHPDYDGLNYIAVYGAIGKQITTSWDEINGDVEFFGNAFGEEGVDWVDAEKDRMAAVEIIKARARSFLEGGGNVWVAEGGQSDITYLWVKALIEEGFSEQIIKNQVFALQHSWWNQMMSSDADDVVSSDPKLGEYLESPISYLFEKVTYLGPAAFRNKFPEDPNEAMEYRLLRNGNGPYRETDPKYRELVLSTEKEEIRALWQEAIDKAAAVAIADFEEHHGKTIPEQLAIWEKEGFEPKGHQDFKFNEACGPTSIGNYGIDFSDTIEILFILDEDALYDDIKGVDQMRLFIEKFVL